MENLGVEGGTKSIEYKMLPKVKENLIEKFPLAIPEKIAAKGINEGMHGSWTS